MQRELLDTLFAPQEAQSRLYGVLIGIVTNNQDPEKLGRVKLKFPWLSDHNESNWARVLAPMAGNGRGFSLLPEVDDEVLVAFEHGIIELPYVLGALWNGKDAPPVEAVQNGRVKLRALKTRAGHTIEFQEDEGAHTGHIVIKTGGGHTIAISDNDKKIEIKSQQHTVTLDDQGGAVTIKSGGTLELSAAGCKLIFAHDKLELSHPGGKLTIAGSGVELSANASLKLAAISTLDAQANVMMNVKSSGVMNIQGSVVKIN